MFQGFHLCFCFYLFILCVNDLLSFPLSLSLAAFSLYLLQPVIGSLSSLPVTSPLPTPPVPAQSALGTLYRRDVSPLPSLSLSF